jgi:hypothetical protein
MATLIAVTVKRNNRWVNGAINVQCIKHVYPTDEGTMIIMDDDDWLVLESVASIRRAWDSNNVIGIARSQSEESDEEDATEQRLSNEGLHMSEQTNPDIEPVTFSDNGNDLTTILQLLKSINNRLGCISNPYELQRTLQIAMRNALAQMVGGKTP